MVTTIRRNMSIQPETEGLQNIRVFINEVVRASEMEETLCNRITLAIDEAVTNIIKHAYEDRRNDAIRITVDVNPKRFEVVIYDTGCSFNPKDVKTPDIQQFVREGRRGGLGVFLMRKIMDEVEYVFQEGVKNELRMVKYL